MARLTLAFLGEPEVRHGAQLLRFPTHKALALLAYLAMEAGEHSRRELSLLFWPESDAAHGRAALRRTLAYLRDGLSEASAAEGESHLVVERDTLAFDFGSEFELDIRTLASATEAAPESRDQVSRLQAAADLCRGEFLTHFPRLDSPAFDNWLSVQREFWHQRVNDVFDQLSRLQSEAGGGSGAVETVTRWLKLNPLNESAYRRLMELHFAAGEREAALRAYRTCRIVLAEELGIEPAPQTVALVERIRGFRVQVSDFGSGPPRRESRVRGLRSALDLPLIGRAIEHARLVEAYHTARRGQTQMVILEGEAGIGKSRLANEFLGWAAAQGADVLRGRAFATGGRVPYQPLVQALRPRLEQENAPEDLLSDVWLTELSRLFPELRDRYPDLRPPGAGEAAARTRLFEAVARLGAALARRTPLLLFVDDVQWADAASLDLLQYAANRWAESGAPALLLFSLRIEALAEAGQPDGAPFFDWLSGLEHALALTHLELDSLTEEDVLQLVQALAGRRTAVSGPPPAVRAFSRWLLAETGGQPFYIMETLKALLERDLLATRLKADGTRVVDFEAVPGGEAMLRAGSSVPPGVQRVIRARLSRLSPLALTLLTAGAVLGQRFDFGGLCRVTGLDADGALPALDELLSARLLVEADEKASLTGAFYFFAHDKIREVVYAEAGDARRRVYHHRALETLQAVGATAAELAHHALAAGLPEPAFRHSLAAGDEAARLFAMRDAIGHYERARSQLSVTSDQGQHLYLQLGRAYDLEGEFEAGRAVYEKMLALAREQRRPTMECAALNGLATLTVHETYDLKGATSLLREALNLAERSGDKGGRAETEWNLAQIGFSAFDATAALSHGERALALARELDLKALTARSLNVIAYAGFLAGRWEEVETHAGEARSLFAALGDRAMETDCLGQIAEARINRGRLQEGIEAGREALAIASEIENPWGEMNSATHLTLGLLDAGAYGEALEIAQQAVPKARTLGNPWMVSFSLSRLGDVQRALLQLESARSTHDEALAINDTMQPPIFTEMIAAALCADCALAKEWDAAQAYARQALAARGGYLSPSGLIRSHEIEALLRGGETEQAREEVHRFGEQIGDNPRFRIPHLRSLAALSEWDGEVEGAIAYLEEAGALAEQIGLPGERWQVLAALGKLHQVRGEDERAQRAFAQADGIVGALAAKIEDEGLREVYLARAKRLIPDA